MGASSSNRGVSVHPLIALSMILHTYLYAGMSPARAGYMRPGVCEGTLAGTSSPGGLKTQRYQVVSSEYNCREHESKSQETEQQSQIRVLSKVHNARGRARAARSRPGISV